MRAALMPIGELADVLRDFGSALCQPSLDRDVDGTTLRLVVDLPLIQLDTLELAERLQHAVDMHQLRLLAERFNIEPAALETLLKRRTDGA